MKKNILNVLLIAFAAVLLILLAVILSNRFRTHFDDLNETDQRILREYDAFCAAGDAPLWPGFDLKDKTILALSKDLWSAYLINPKQEVNSFLAAKIDLPDDFCLSSVYRVSVLTPQVWAIRSNINFNTIGKTETLFGNELYFMTYDREVSLDQPYSSQHFITLLAHESFHYYMQNQWIMEPLLNTELTDAGYELLREEYDVFAAIQSTLASEHPDRAYLLKLAKDYVAIVDRRLEEDPAYVTWELSEETAEGTAQYVGILASQRVGYDHGVMYFDNVKNVPFSNVFQQLDNGTVGRIFLSERGPYETGSQLCLLMDALGVPGWQEALNSQTLEAPQTLYSVLKAFLETQEA